MPSNRASALSKQRQATGATGATGTAAITHVAPGCPAMRQNAFQNNWATLPVPHLREGHLTAAPGQGPCWDASPATLPSTSQHPSWGSTWVSDTKGWELGHC